MANWVVGSRGDGGYILWLVETSTRGEVWGKVLFLHLFVYSPGGRAGGLCMMSLPVWRKGVSAKGSLWRGLCEGGGVCEGGLCEGGLCKVDLCKGGLYEEGSPKEKPASGQRTPLAATVASYWNAYLFLICS